MKKTVGAILALLCMLVCLPAFCAGRVQIEEGPRTLYEGETLQLRAVCAEEGTLTWQSWNERAATVDETGKVTGVGRGQSTITCTLDTGKITYRTSVTLEVLRRVEKVEVQERNLTVLSPSDPSVRPLLTLSSDLPVLLLMRGGNVYLQANARPDDASNRRLRAESDDESVVRVSGMNLQAVGKGDTVVRVVSQDNPQAMAAYHVLVIERVTGIRVSAEGRETFVGGKLRMKAEVSPQSASIRDVTWESGNEKVATVDADGVVTGHARGSAEIRARARDGSGRYGSLWVQVAQQAERVELSESEVTVAVGYQKGLRATVFPENTSDRSVVWSSSDEGIARVSPYGYIQPVKAGECDITCASRGDPAVFALCHVRVTQPVTRITFGERAFSVDAGAAIPLVWTVEPADVTDANVTFSSSNERVATVDVNGVVHGLQRGDVTITARATDGSNRQGRVTVHVIQRVMGVHMKSDTIRVGVGERYTLTAVLEPENANNRNMTWTIDDEYYAKIRGTNNRPSVTGRHWGDTVARGVTEDGNFAVECTIQVGNYNRALKITDLYLRDNAVKIVVENESNMNITTFYGIIALYDIYGQPLPCTLEGANSFECSYSETLYEGDVTRHGRFGFRHYQQPSAQIGRVTMAITGYCTDTGYSRNIRESALVYAEYKTANYLGYVP